MKVKLTSSRCGHKYDGKTAPGLPHGRFIGVFAEAAGQTVDMPKDEAERYLASGLAVLPEVTDKK